MVTESNYDFFGGYDHARKAGMVHTSNHHIAPGKKLWTWGNAEFGYAWDRNLTDEDGPYVELMAGAYTDNQPDFSWLQPYETRTFSQFWYPIQEIGPAKNANKEAAVNLEFDGNRARVGVSVTSLRRVRIVLASNGRFVLDEEANVAPGRPFTKVLETDGARPEKFKLIVRDVQGYELISWQPERRIDRELPSPATEPPPPAEIASIEELYLTGLHLEQYRHATRSPEAYWIEGLDRDPEDARLNNAMGLFLLRNGNFAEAENHFARADRRLTVRNPNPRDGEPFYNLGLARFYQGKTAEAYDAFHKSIWNYAWQSAGNYALASISAGRGDLQLALEQVETSLRTNSDHSKARALKVSLLRHLERRDEARAVIDDALALDPLDFRTMSERFLLSRSHSDFNALLVALDGDLQTLLDVTFDLAWSGLQDDAYFLLESFPPDEKWDHPMRWYSLSWLAAALNKPARAVEFLAKAEAASPRYCFPARIEEMIVLKSAIARNPSSARAHYYLGNLYYDKRRYDEAIRSWRRSVELDGSFSIPWRNLGIAEFNVLRNPQAADRMYQKAFSANPADARLLYEWDQLKKRARLASPLDRLGSHEKHPELVARRDDLTVEFVTLLNQAGKFHEALSVLKNRRFNPWEGGEGLASAQYVYAHRALGSQALVAARPCDALKSFTAARNYPHNLGEGKHLLTLERDLDYFSGLAAEQCGDRERASRFWKAAAAPLPEPGIHSYFQAMAWRELGGEEAAQEVLSNLARFAEDKRKAVAKIDYFATSLPNLLLFDDDLEERNRIESLLLSALADHGLGHTEKAIGELRQVIAMDPNHLSAISVLEWIEQASRLTNVEPEVRPAS
jgi:tetratricopeptide (TPR) repeat protein